jgi:hypothetical protein
MIRLLRPTAQPREPADESVDRRYQAVAGNFTPVFAWQR